MIPYCGCEQNLYGRKPLYNVNRDNCGGRGRRYQVMTKTSYLLNNALPDSMQV